MSERREEIVDAARRILEAEGIEALTMRRVGSEVGMRAPSLYKHFPNKRTLEAALIEQALEEIGERLHQGVGDPDQAGSIASLLRAYREVSLASPHLYRLATGPNFPRELLAPGLEEWAGEPFFLAVGDPQVAQALWAFAHGMAILEIEGRFPVDSDLDRTWASGVAVFTT